MSGWLAETEGLPAEPSPAPTRGMLSHNREIGLSTCHRCWWRGPVPTIGGVLQHECPRCDVAPAVDAAFRPVAPRPKISRNAPCPCGSGLKAKKCPCGALSGLLSA